MEDPDPGDRGRYLRDRHAPAGHQERKGSDGHIHRGSCAPDPVLRGAERAGKHPQAAGAGHCGGQGAWRAVRQAAQAAAGGILSGLPQVESGENHRHGGGKGVRDAALYVPV